LDNLSNVVLEDKMNLKTAKYGLILIILASTATAARVGVVVDDGQGGITQRCYDVEDGLKAELVCDKPGFECTYEWGPAMVCNIFGKGTDCKWEGYFWGFYTKTSGDEDWKFSNFGVSDVEVEDQMMLGFNWQSAFSGVPFTNPSFCEVCGCGGGGKAKRIPKILGMAFLPVQPNTGEPVTIQLTDNKTEKPVKYAVIEVFDGVVGITPPLFKGESDGEGEVEFNVDEPGEYTVRITGTKYPHEYATFNVSDTTTTTTSTTTSTTTTSTTTTTIKLPEHFLFKTTTTAPAPTTTTLKEPGIIGAAAKPPEEENPLARLLDWLLDLLPPV